MYAVFENFRGQRYMLVGVWDEESDTDLYPPAPDWAQIGGLIEGYLDAMAFVQTVARAIGWRDYSIEVVQAHRD